MLAVFGPNRFRELEDAEAKVSKNQLVKYVRYKCHETVRIQ